MKIDINTPQPLHRGAYFELPVFWQWAAALVKNLKNLIYNLDDDNIRSVSSSKLLGGINIRNNPISSESFTCSEGSFILMNDDGSQYIKLENGKLTIKADIVSDE
ncbi:MAG: hypothetical protein IJH37_05015 [Clostridia bacterium]|nr:hypothetical protein [Clostridia bacterium]